jgi:hypothetical protein
MDRNRVPPIVNLFIYSGLLGGNKRWHGGEGGEDLALYGPSYEHVGGDVCSHLICPQSHLYSSRPNIFM